MPSCSGSGIRLGTNPEGWAAEAEAEATRAIAVFDGLGEERGLAEGWSLLGLVRVMNAQFGPAEEAWEQAAAHAAEAGVRRDELESLAWVPLLMWAGPTPVEQGLRRCLELLERSGGDKKARSSALMAQAAFEAPGRPRAGSANPHRQARVRSWRRSR